MNPVRSKRQAIGIAIILTYGSYIAGVVLISGAVFGLRMVGFQLLERPALRLLTSTVMLQGITFGGLAILYLRFRGLSLDFVPIDVPTKWDVAVFVLGVFGLFALLSFVSIVFSVAGIPVAENNISIIASEQPNTFLLLIPLSILLVGPGEELLYRGIIQGELRTTMSPLRAIVFSSALFASIHLFSLSGSGKYSYIIIAFLLSLCLGAIYEYTDNLVVPILVHGMFNAAQFGLTYLSANGVL